LDGSYENDTLDGGPGDDVLFGGDGTDVLYGGDGNDQLIITAAGLEGIGNPEAGNQSFGGDGDDTVLLYTGNSADGGAGRDYLTMVLETLDGDTIIDTTPYHIDLRPLDTGGTVTFRGGLLTGFEIGRVLGASGDDIIRVGRASFDVFGGDGDDRIRVGGANLGSGGNGDDMIRGGAGSNLLLGGDGADTLIGGKGHDTLNGGQRADVLIGGTDGTLFRSGGGHDRLEIAGESVVERGGGGADILVVLNATALNSLSEDLRDADVIDLSGIDADAFTPGDQAFVQVTTFSGSAGEMRLALVSGETLLQVDRNGDGLADAEALTLEGDHSTYANFVV
jgi:Ca2+-binding RTX toxin-like protein